MAVIEDGVKTGGVGEYLENLLYEHDFKNVSVFAFPEKFFAQGTRAQILEEAGLSAREISKKLLTELKSTQRA